MTLNVTVFNCNKVKWKFATLKEAIRPSNMMSCFYFSIVQGGS